MEHVPCEVLDVIITFALQFPVPAPDEKTTGYSLPRIAPWSLPSGGNGNGANLSAFSLINSKWHRAIRESEMIPGLLATLHFHWRHLFPLLRFDGEAVEEDVGQPIPSSRSTSSTHPIMLPWATFKGRVLKAKELKPLKVETLHPIEDCARALAAGGCPGFGECLTLTDDSGNAPLRYQCHICQKDLRVLAKPPRNGQDNINREEANDAGAFIFNPIRRGPRKHKGGDMRRNPNQETYKFYVFDSDEGATTERFSRMLRTVEKHYGSASYTMIGNCSMSHMPSFRFRAGSCAHQYEALPVPASVLAIAGGGKLLPKRANIFYRVNLVPPGDDYGIDAAAAATSAKNIPIPDEVVAQHQEAGSSKEPYSDTQLGEIAKVVLKALEMGCGSESDSDSGDDPWWEVDNGSR